MFMTRIKDLCKENIKFTWPNSLPNSVQKGSSTEMRFVQLYVLLLKWYFYHGCIIYQLHCRTKWHNGIYDYNSAGILEWGRLQHCRCFHKTIKIDTPYLVCEAMIWNVFSKSKFDPYFPLEWWKQNLVTSYYTITWLNYIMGFLMSCWMGYLVHKIAVLFPTAEIRS